MVLAAGLFAGEEKIPLDNLPKAVVESVKKKFPKGEMKDAVKEVENGKTTYEVTVMEGEIKIDVNVKDDGVITGYEKSVALKDLPKIISDAVVAKYPKGTMKNAEMLYKVKDDKDTLEYYEVFVEVDGKTVEVYVLPNGKLKPADKK